jgi:fatty-acyl-CoA synthase
MTVPKLRQSESIGRFLERRAAARPGAGAVVWGEETIGLGALLDESRRVAQGLSELCVGTGDPVALWLPNTPAWFALYLACARLGAIAVAVNTRFRASEIADIVGRSGAQFRRHHQGRTDLQEHASLARATSAAHIVLTWATSWSSALPQPSWKPISACFFRPASSRWMAMAV